MHTLKIHTYECPQCHIVFESTRKDADLHCPSFFCNHPITSSNLTNTTEVNVPKIIFTTFASSVFMALNKHSSDLDIFYSVVDELLLKMARGEYFDQIL